MLIQMLIQMLISMQRPMRYSIVSELTECRPFSNASTSGSSRSVDGAATLKYGAVFNDQAGGYNISIQTAGGKKDDASPGLDGATNLPAHHNDASADIGIYYAALSYQDFAVCDDETLEVAINSDEIFDFEFSAKLGAFADQGIDD